MPLPKRQQHVYNLNEVFETDSPSFQTVFTAFQLSCQFCLLKKKKKPLHASITCLKSNDIIDIHSGETC